jgi:Ca-activated chloride channel homolog
MKRCLLSLLGFLLVFAPAALAQGILIPENSRIAPFPRPLPGPGPHPLRVKILKVDTRIQGQVATTRVTQVFFNDLGFVVDGTYFYPLPEDATFVDFATWDGDRKLRGEVLEREEARNRYLAIVRRSWDPGLLEYAGANLFQARVFPVPAHGEKRVEFAYSQILKADHGLVSYTYPLQSGTRVNPQPIDSAAVTVEIGSDQNIRNLYSPTHRIDIRREGERRARLSYEGSALLPDRNFQLFYSTAVSGGGFSLITYREAADEGYFMILLTPESDRDREAAIPKDILFVLDTSGSMQEKGKLEKALAALKFGVRSLHAGDRFNIITFSTETRKFRDGLVPASEEVRAAAQAFIERQTASGGTNIHEALREAMGNFQAGTRPRYLVFLTDGLPTVGETDPGRILQDTTNPLKARVFTFGVGYDVNTFLLDQIAARNYGASDYVTPDEDLEVKLSNFFAKASSPVLTGLSLDLGGLNAFDIYPRQLPDLFQGSQLTILGRYSNSGSFPVTVRGSARGDTKALRFDHNEFPDTASANDFLPRLWAMRKVGYLLEQIRIAGENPELKNEIIRLAKKYGFVTPYTSYLAADEKDLLTGNFPSRQRPMHLQMGMPSMVGGVSAAPSPAAAREAVSASIALKAMKTGDVAQSADGAGARTVGAKTFRLENGTWIDTAFDAVGNKLPVISLVFGSDAMLKALAADPQLAAYAALGKNVTVIHKSKVYKITAA